MILFHFVRNNIYIYICIQFHFDKLFLFNRKIYVIHYRFQYLILNLQFCSYLLCRIFSRKKRSSGVWLAALLPFAFSPGLYSIHSHCKPSPKIASVLAIQVSCFCSAFNSKYNREPR